MVIMSGPTGERRRLALLPDARHGIEDVLPLGFPSETTADIGCEVGKLPVVEQRPEARHQRSGSAVAGTDTVQDDVEEIVRGGMVGDGAERQGHRPRYRQAGTAV